MEESKQKVESIQNTEPQEPKMVSLEQYEALYNQAKALELRYRKLFELYNTLLEKYLGQNN
jgi:hypothetical protein